MARGAFCDRVTYGILRSQQPYSSLSQATQATNSNHEISMPSHDNPKNINPAKTIRFIQTQSNTGRCRGPVQSCPCNTQHEQIWTVPGSWQPPVPQGVRRPVPCCAAAPALFTCPWDSVHCCAAAAAAGIALISSTSWRRYGTYGGQITEEVKNESCGVTRPECS